MVILERVKVYVTDIPRTGTDASYNLKFVRRHEVGVRAWGV